MQVPVNLKATASGTASRGIGKSASNSPTIFGKAATSFEIALIAEWQDVVTETIFGNATTASEILRTRDLRNEAERRERSANDGKKSDVPTNP